MRNPNPIRRVPTVPADIGGKAAAISARLATATVRPGICWLGIPDRDMGARGASIGYSVGVEICPN